MLLSECAALAPLLEAFARGTKRSRLRQLVVVCPAGHTLTEVFPTADGPHAVWPKHVAWEDVDGELVMTHRTEWLAGPLFQSVDVGEGLAEVRHLQDSASCRCTEQARVDGVQLQEWLAQETRRVVADI